MGDKAVILIVKKGEFHTLCPNSSSRLWGDTLFPPPPKREHCGGGGSFQSGRVSVNPSLSPEAKELKWKMLVILLQIN